MKIEIIPDAPYKPYKSISKKIITPRLKKILQKIKHITPLKGKYGDLKAIAKHYGIKLELRYKYSLAGGFVVSKNKIILFVGKEQNSQKKIRINFCHELAHFFQKKCKIFCDYGLGFLNLSGVVRYEQEAQAFSAELFKILFPELKFDRKNFKDYFHKAHYLWLHNYYKEYSIINNLYRWQSRNCRSN